MLDKATETLLSTLTETAWAQWAALGGPVSRGDGASSLVDPEALLLVSLYLRDRERRLWDALVWWARERSGLLSVQRVKNLAASYPEEITHRLAQFAGRAAREASDARWKRLAGEGSGPEVRPSTGRSGRPRISDPAALVLRLRLGIGVGVKPDLLAVLVGLGGDAVRVSALADATAFASRSVKRAADEMAEAQLLRAHRDGPTEYRAEPAPWAELLRLPSPPPRWRHWHPLFAFAVQALECLQQLDAEEPGRHVASSRLRTLVENHRAAFDRNRIPIPEPADHPGADYLTAFEETLTVVSDWMSENV